MFSCVWFLFYIVYHYFLISKYHIFHHSLGIIKLILYIDNAFKRKQHERLEHYLLQRYHSSVEFHFIQTLNTQLCFFS